MSSTSFVYASNEPVVLTSSLGLGSFHLTLSRSLSTKTIDSNTLMTSKRPLFWLEIRIVKTGFYKQFIVRKSS